jgi:hypothetical protein
MMLNANRLRKLLPQYTTVSESTTDKSIIMCRASDVPDLYEWLEVIGQGKAGEAVYGHVGVSVVGGRNATRGLIEERSLTELATDSGAGWTILHSKEETVAWERKFSELAPSQAQAMVQGKGASLLARTSEARKSVERYLESLPKGLKDLDMLLAHLKGQASASLLDKAVRWAEWPGVLQVDKWEGYYLAAALLIAQDYPDADPLEDFQLMSRIQILVDRLRRLYPT